MPNEIRGAVRVAAPLFSPFDLTESQNPSPRRVEGVRYPRGSDATTPDPGEVEGRSRTVEVKVLRALRLQKRTVRCSPSSSAFAFTVEPDRKKAIEFALREAAAGDVVIVAGKGHETTQEIAGVKYPFDDREVVRAFGSGD